MQRVRIRSNTDGRWYIQEWVGVAAPGGYHEMPANPFLDPNQDTHAQGSFTRVFDLRDGEQLAAYRREGGKY